MLEYCECMTDSRDVVIGREKSVQCAILDCDLCSMLCIHKSGGCGLSGVVCVGSSFGLVLRCMILAGCAFPQPQDRTASFCEVSTIHTHARPSLSTPYSEYTCTPRACTPP